MADYDLASVVAESPHKNSKGRFGTVVKITPKFVTFLDDEHALVTKQKDLVKHHNQWEFHDEEVQEEATEGCLIKIFRGRHAGKMVRIEKMTEKMLFFKGGRCSKRNVRWIRDDPLGAFLTHHAETMNCAQHEN